MHRPSLPVRALWPVLALFSAACSPIQLPTATEHELEHLATGAVSRAPGESASGPGDYPLAIGNSWHFEGRLTVTEYPVGEPPIVAYDATRAVATDLICVESRNGREYVVERSITTEAGIDYPNYVRMREDGSGLFEADLSTSTPPACAGGDAVALRGPRTSGEELGGDLSWVRLRGLDPERRERVATAMREVGRRLGALRGRLPGLTRYGRPGDGVAAGELTRLLYPLRPGQRWLIRDEPGPVFESWVEGPIALDTPLGRFPAQRVRVRAEAFGPRDFVVLYYGRSGFLGVQAHFETEGSDPSGTPTGLMIVEDELVLDGIDLAGAGPR